MTQRDSWRRALAAIDKAQKGCVFRRAAWMCTRGLLRKGRAGSEAWRKKPRRALHKYDLETMLLSAARAGPAAIFELPLACAKDGTKKAAFTTFLKPCARRAVGCAGGSRL